MGLDLRFYISRLIHVMLMWLAHRPHHLGSKGLEGSTLTHLFPVSFYFFLLFLRWSLYWYNYGTFHLIVTSDFDIPYDNLFEIIKWNHSFRKYLLRTHHVQGILLYIGHRGVNKRKSYSREAFVLLEEANNYQIINKYTKSCQTEISAI